MNETCENDYATLIYDNPCYFDKSYDNPLFVPTIDMHDNEECCLEFFYDKALDDGPMLLDDINCPTVESGFGEIMTLITFDPTSLKLDKNYPSNTPHYLAYQQKEQIEDYHKIYQNSMDYHK